MRFSERLRDGKRLLTTDLSLKIDRRFRISWKTFHAGK